MSESKVSSGWHLIEQFIWIIAIGEFIALALIFYLNKYPLRIITTQYHPSTEEYTDSLAQMGSDMSSSIAFFSDALGSARDSVEAAKCQKLRSEAQTNLNKIQMLLKNTETLRNEQHSGNWTDLIRHIQDGIIDLQPQCEHIRYELLNYFSSSNTVRAQNLARMDSVMLALNADSIKVKNLLDSIDRLRDKITALRSSNSAINLEDSLLLLKYVDSVKHLNQKISYQQVGIDSLRNDLKTVTDNIIPISIASFTAWTRLGVHSRPDTVIINMESHIPFGMRNSPNNVEIKLQVFYPVKSKHGKHSGSPTQNQDEKISLRPGEKITRRFVIDDKLGKGIGHAAVMYGNVCLSQYSYPVE